MSVLVKFEYEAKEDLEKIIKTYYKPQIIEESGNLLSNGWRLNLLESDLRLEIDKTHEVFNVISKIGKLQVKVCNVNLIDGCMVFKIDEVNEDKIFLIPSSTYSIKNEDLYTFY